MSYGLGKWPTEELLTLEPETKLEFFVYRSPSNAAFKKRQYAMLIAKRRVERRAARDAGEMRPLEYWVRLGYEAERLRAHSGTRQVIYRAMWGNVQGVCRHQDF